MEVIEITPTKTNNKATICLNMIVKDESHIIKGTLEMLCSKIKFDYWVICDTGSSDGTPEIIVNFFKEKNIQGELYKEKWVNFAHNRTSALEKAYGKTDLLLIFDADDEIHGEVQMPMKVMFDEYHMKFGSPMGTSYTRVLLINNRKRFKYFSVIHEFISCQEPNGTSGVLEGNYYVVSGRSGSRNKDPDKYLKDALVLEKAHAEAVASKDPLYQRYAFYCANSYKDCGKFEEAVKWYKITLDQDNWAQEKYVSCLYAYDCLTLLKRKEEGFFYLVKAFQYDIERVECLFPLLVHYCCDNMNQMAYNYYLNVKTFFETKYLETDMTKKLFINLDKGNFFVPYYMILIADKVQDFDCVLRMYEIVFLKKQRMFETWYIKNFLYNLQFFIKYVKSDNFFLLANEYIRFLKDNNVPLYSFDFLKDYEQYGINIDSIYNIDVKKETKFSKNDCFKSKNILIYVGFSDTEWNYSYITNNALGGSEKAVAYLSKNFPKEYNIYVSGDVKAEQIDNIQYIHLRELSRLCDVIPFHTVICSRYIAFLEMFQNASYYQFYIWAHDTHLIPYGYNCNLSEGETVAKWNKYIDGCVCQTEWHANEYKTKYPQLKDKMHIINNGINTSLFPLVNKKQPNKFIYTSRTERGLTILLELWQQILEYLPDAQLVISTYTKFPSNPEEERIKTIIDKYDSVKHIGQLNTEQLYSEMSTSEFWLYPSIYPETSCITALEMLMSGVICLYYPYAGLPYTMKEHGIQIEKGNEIDKLMSLTIKQKRDLVSNGRKYAESCSWEERGKLWSELLFSNQKSEIESEIESKIETKWWVYALNYNTDVLIEYSKGLKTKYNIEFTDNFQLIMNSKPAMVSFIYGINHLLYTPLLKFYPNCVVSLLNLEPLNLFKRRAHIISTYNAYNQLKIYDYSLSNIQILKDNGVTNVEHLPYIITNEETQMLSDLKAKTNQIYDFGILTGSGATNNSINELGPKRKQLVRHLLEKGFSVNIIKGWGQERDTELSKCNVILNIHGQINPSPDVWEDSMIFEHIRCDRLLAAGFNILSETCEQLDVNYSNKYLNNLKLIDFQDFFSTNINIVGNWLQQKKNQLNCSDTIDTIDITNIDITQRKIVDCFIFYNELEMLKYRLNVLNDTVDYFIIVEARQTHIGASKPLYFNENRHLFEKFSSKIIHIVVDLLFTKDTINIPNGDQWKNEKYQRNCIHHGIKQIESKLNPEDLLIIADLDEIPDPETLKQLKNSSIILVNGISSFEQDFYYYNLNSKRNEKWYHAKVLTFKKYNELAMNCSDIRFVNCNELVKGGWHLSYFGDSQFIKNKLENFAHQEYNSFKFTDPDEIQKKINNQLDLFGRQGNNDMKRVEITDNNYLPPLYDTYLKSFYDDLNLKQKQNQNQNQKQIKKYCFIHSCTFLHNGTIVLDKIVNLIKSSGLIDALDKVFINNIGEPIQYNYGSKFILTNYSENKLLYENPTINKIKHFVDQMDEPCYILYLHTKGNSYFKENLAVTDWTNMMLYFLVEKYKTCFDKFDLYDAIGCNYHTKPTPHFSGNFWWAKSSHINTLDLIDEETALKYTPELWLLKNNDENNKSTICCIHWSGPDTRYFYDYPREKYALE